MKRILIVDDDEGLLDLLSKYLEGAGFAVDTLTNGQSIDNYLKNNHCNLIILDIMLPGEDGFSICRRLRANSSRDIPIIMLTAKRQKIDRILGLEMGADDFLAKPFDPRELLARINAVLRRYALSSHATSIDKQGSLLTFGVFSMDLATHTLTKNGQDIWLTAGEFELLRILCAHPAEPMSRARLMKLTRGRNADPLDRTIDVQISRLRRAIEDNPNVPRYIKTVRGFGYVFVVE